MDVLLCAIVTFIASWRNGVAVSVIASGPSIPFKAGDDLTLKCGLEEQHEVYSYFWMKDETQQLRPSENSSVSKYQIDFKSGELVVQQANKADVGTYQCFQKSQRGLSVGSKVSIIQAVLDSFPNIKNPVIREPTIGSPLKLECHPPRSVPSDDVYWGELLPGSKLKPLDYSQRISQDYEGNLYFANIVAEDGRSGSPYICAINNGILRRLVQGDDQIVKPQRVPAVATVHSPPKLMWSSSPTVVVLKGQLARMKCIFAGLPTPRVSWKFTSEDNRDQQLPPNAQLSSFGQELLIREADFDNAGRYECTGLNAEIGPAVTSKFRLKVESIPSLVHASDDVEVFEDQDIALECTASSVPKPFITWTSNGKPVNVSRVTINSTHLTIERSIKADAQVLQCNASNVHGFILLNIQVNVRSEGPTLTQRPNYVVKVAEGHSVILPCRAIGGPVPVISWLRGQRTLTNETNETNVILHANGDLELINVSRATQDDYKCVAENRYGVEMAVVHLLVRKPTVIIEAPHNRKVKALSDVTFNCAAVTDQTEMSTLHLTWHRTESGQGLSNGTGGRVVIASSHVGTSSLRIISARLSDTGSYTCKASNGIDSTSTDAWLVVQDRPERPGNVSIIACNARSLQLSWTPGADNNDPIIGYDVFYNTSFDKEYHAVHHEANMTSTTTTSDTSMEISMLPWRSYSFIVRARNQVGVGEFSDRSKGKCMSAAARPSSHPTRVCSRSRGSRQLVIVWKPVNPSAHNGDGFHYLVHYKRLKLDDAQPYVQRVNGWRESQLVVENQPTYVEYEISVEAVNIVGSAPTELLETRIGYSGQGVPSVIPSNVSFNKASINGTSVELTWDAVDESVEKVHGFFRGYQIRFWKVGDHQNYRAENIGLRSFDPCPLKEKGHTTYEHVESTTTTAPTGKPHEVVHGWTHKLWPFSTIEAVVMVMNGAQYGPPSERVQFQTPEGSSGPVADFAAYELGSDHIRVEWLPPNEPNGIIVSYAVYCRPVFDELVDKRSFTVSSDAPLRLKIANLLNDTAYMVSIWAINSAGKGDQSDVEVSTLPAAAPSKPVVSGIIPGDNFVFIYWKSLELNPGSAFFIERRLLRGQEGWTRTVADNEECWSNITEVCHGCVYEIRVVAANNFGETLSETVQVVASSNQGQSLQDQSFPTYLRWAVVVLIVILVLLVCVVIVCVVKRCRETKYFVNKMEQMNSVEDDDINEDLEFGDISQIHNKLTNHYASSDSATNSSGSDSLCEYGEPFPDTTKFNEDGSFIGLYSYNEDGGDISVIDTKLYYNEPTAF